ncbi:uncharacterized protein LOC131225725 isoform X2 [Magnolia sinica]|uniref:uncharacterized protein LOC131225725 isoform X2 n=1 Tax=Magnolia sinica TaxID=86752 RepID=UPI00265A1CA6|nr:uncharacterized protein LOC131225725 isoform X2 [Magnolia sinica]XP_058077288.1 uncharacterized protein LOC131225725 isoform X2 [Magnolia sinica]
MIQIHLIIWIGSQNRKHIGQTTYGLNSWIMGEVCYIVPRCGKCRNYLNCSNFIFVNYSLCCRLWNVSCWWSVQANYHTRDMTQLRQPLLRYKTFSFLVEGKRLYGVHKKTTAAAKDPCHEELTCCVVTPHVPSLLLKMSLLLQIIFGMQISLDRLDLGLFISAVVRTSHNPAAKRYPWSYRLLYLT